MPTETHRVCEKKQWGYASVNSVMSGFQRGNSTLDRGGGMRVAGVCAEDDGLEPGSGDASDARYMKHGAV
jgi:hypothetical protein